MRNLSTADRDRWSASAGEPLHFQLLLSFVCQRNKGLSTTTNDRHTYTNLTVLVTRLCTWLW